ncbi:hypothetical protein, partial [Gluconobacter oxydans]|uniref:hypothetical protein n=1 Tax=Gluconobacter oxydans TaxID=442 RepID=UPI000794C5D6
EGRRFKSCPRNQCILHQVPFVAFTLMTAIDQNVSFADRTLKGGSVGTNQSLIPDHSGSHGDIVGCKGWHLGFQGKQF